MRKTISMSVIAAFFAISAAQAAGQPEPRTTTTPIPGINYRCWFGKDHGQKDDLKCWVKGQLCSELKSGSESNYCHSYKDPIEVRCNNGFKFESEDSAVSIEHGTVWVNASKWHKIVTLKIDDFNPITVENSERGLDANLVVANRRDFDLEGKCKLFPTGETIGSEFEE